MSLNFLLSLSYLASVIKDGFLSQVMNELFGNEEEPFGEEGRYKMFGYHPSLDFNFPVNVL